MGSEAHSNITNIIALPHSVMAEIAALKPR
jgi:hypothetical protein